jgi:hypothetical protein
MNSIGFILQTVQMYIRINMQVLNQYASFQSMEDGSPSGKIQLAMDGVMDNSKFAIAIAVGIFGILTLFVQIAIAQPESFDPLTPKNLVIWITLTVAYWVLIVMGLVSHAYHRMNTAMVENIKKSYQEYKEDMRNATKGNWIMTLAIKRFWLDKPTEKVNKE